MSAMERDGPVAATLPPSDEIGIAERVGICRYLIREIKDRVKHVVEVQHRRERCNDLLVKAEMMEEYLQRVLQPGARQITWEATLKHLQDVLEDLAPAVAMCGESGNCRPYNCFLISDSPADRLDRAETGLAHAKEHFVNDIQRIRLLDLTQGPLQVWVNPWDEKCRAADCFYFGDGVPRNFMEAVKRYKEAADHGHAPSMCRLGWCKKRGQGVTQSTADAAQLFAQATVAGDKGGQFALGLLYEKGEGVPQDPIQAAKLYRRSANQGYEEAQFRLGRCYAEGNGVPKNEKEAVKWFRKAANWGNASAEGALGMCYRMGLGVDKNFRLAFEWFQKAAKQGTSYGQLHVGLCYLKGQGVGPKSKKNDKEGFKWVKKAAEQGNADAEFMMGVCYENSQGVSKNLKEAVKWWEKAEIQRHEDAHMKLYGSPRAIPISQHPLSQTQTLPISHNPITA